MEVIDKQLVSCVGFSNAPCWIMWGCQKMVGENRGSIFFTQVLCVDLFSMPAFVHSLPAALQDWLFLVAFGSVTYL